MYILCTHIYPIYNENIKNMNIQGTHFGLLILSLLLADI